MHKLSLAVIAVALSGALHADPPTPPSHSASDFRPIGDGLYVASDEKAEADRDGNTEITVFSRAPINAGPHYSLDLSPLWGIPKNDLEYDGGKFGTLRALQITLDCTHQTYEVIDPRMLIPNPIWRPASTLPALAPVFKFACAHAGQHR
jgi:hypothetical protein